VTPTNPLRVSIICDCPNECEGTTGFFCGRQPLSYSNSPEHLLRHYGALLPNRTGCSAACSLVGSMRRNRWAVTPGQLPPSLLARRHFSFCDAKKKPTGIFAGGDNQRGRYAIQAPIHLSAEPLKSGYRIVVICVRWVRSMSAMPTTPGGKGTSLEVRVGPNSGSHRLYSITLSARSNSAGGTVTPIAFAVLRLITRSNLGHGNCRMR